MQARRGGNQATKDTRDKPSAILLRTDLEEEEEGGEKAERD
jgi:hypothetical protein